MTNTALCQILATVAPSGGLVRVVGRAGFQESPEFHRFVVDALTRAESVVVDLSSCDNLDSTMQGCLVDLHKQYNAAGTLRVLLFVPPPARAHLFAATHLDRYLPFAEQMPSAVEADDPLVPLPVATEELGRHVALCHKRLADLGGPKSDAFMRVAESIAKDLKGP